MQEMGLKQFQQQEGLQMEALLEHPSILFSCLSSSHHVLRLLSTSESSAKDYCQWPVVLLIMILSPHNFPNPVGDYSLLRLLDCDLYNVLFVWIV